MCGLISIISKEKFGINHTDKTTFLQMLFADTLRGFDGTGIYMVNRHGNLYSAKKSIYAPAFIGNPDVDKLMSDAIRDGQLLVGHNRKATMGAKTDENAHPFIEDHICLVHNGTLQSHKELADTQIDSHAICVALAKTTNPKEVLEKINGAFALIWYNAKEKSLYFCRNTERPLAFIETKSKIYIASEEKMLDWIIDRNISETYKIQEVPTFKLFKFNLDTLKLENLGKFESKKTKQSYINYPIVTHNYSSFGNNQNKNKKKEKVYPDFSIGDTIAFCPISIQDKEHTILLEGLSWYDENDYVVSYFKKEDLDDVNELLSNDLLCGKITQVKYNTKSNIYTYIIKDVKPDIEAVSKNNVKVSVNLLESTETCCSMCGEVWKQSETLEESKKRVEECEIITDSEDSIINLICDECVKNWNINYACC
ncbi:MAG TPA: class II glutamine amidotransferase [Chitinophagales bacterium]|nr:class II glutamine amidotransferase [Chitinophagales bacterium]HMY41901.1 class II glutamine amidotransferase [Chitinophagales bacterium]HNG27792.1 class II glutamine amidotransferase [Chitinophagales bacterium]